jgi:hypothetical protein
MTVAIDRGDRLSELLQMRIRTDVHIGAGWIFFAVASYILWMALAVLSVTGLLQQIPSFGIPVLVGSIFFDATAWLSLLGLSASAGLAYLVFRVVDRQNKHALRMQEVFSEALKRIESETRPGQTSILLALSSAEQDFSAMIQKTHERSGVLWAILVLVPYLGWVFLIIALYQLSQASNLHEQSERPLFEDLDRILGNMDTQNISLNNRYLPSRNSAGFLLASLLTIGLFSVVWLYQMVSSPQDHFSYHSDFEPKLLATFEGSQFAGGATK